jgi:type 1 fimbria pilin
MALATTLALSAAHASGNGTMNAQLTVEGNIVAATCTINDNLDASVPFGSLSPGVLNPANAGVTRDVLLPIRCTGLVTPTGLTFSPQGKLNADTPPDANDFRSTSDKLFYKVTTMGWPYGIADGTRVKPDTDMLTGVTVSALTTTGVPRFGIRIRPEAVVTALPADGQFEDNIQVTLSY